MLKLKKFAIYDKLYKSLKTVTVILDICMAVKLQRM